MVNEDVYQEIKKVFDQAVRELGLEGHVRIQNSYDCIVSCEVNILYAHGKRRLLVNELGRRLNALPCMDRKANGPVDDDYFDEHYAKEYEIDPEYPEEKDEEVSMPFFVKDGLWSHTEADDKIAAEDEAALREEEERQEAEYQAELKARHANWRENLIPIPPPPKNATDEVYLTLDYEYYDMIKSGEKTTEFREYSPYWVKRLLSHPIKTVRFQRGYGGPGHPPPEQMVFKVKDVVLYEIETKKECPPDNPCEGILPTHIAIDLGERIEDPTSRTVGKVDAKAVYDKRVWGVERCLGDEMMKARFEGKEVYVLALNKVALYAVEQGVFTAMSLDLKGVPERGEVYLFCDPFADEDRLRGDYRDLKKFTKESGVKVPTLSKIPDCNGSVNGKADYRISQEDGGTWIEFENVQPLDRLYEIVGGEFVEYQGPADHE